MTITPFGLIFITLGLTIRIARPAWLLPLLIVSAVLQAFSVANIDHGVEPVVIGITPWLFTCTLIFTHLAAIIIHNRRLELGSSQPVRFLFWGWMIFIGWCVLGAFTLPFLFEGTPIHPASNWGISNGALVPSTWNFVNAIQAVNALIISMLLIYVLQLNKDANMTKLLTSGFILAALVSVGIGFLQRFQLAGIISTPLNVLYLSLNPSYAQGDFTQRIGWPFTEPSYTSVWYLGVLIGGAVIYLFASRPWAGILLIFVGILGFLNSLAGSGLAGLPLALISMTAVSFAKCRQNAVPLQRTLWRFIRIILFVGLIVISYIAARDRHPLLPDVYSSIQYTAQERIAGPIRFRGQSNLDAITITKNTWGFGMGLGSNRASSYLFSVMSNVGVFGLAMLLALVVYQLNLLVFGSAISRTLNGLIFGGTVGMFCGLVMGIPDVMFPAWWIWLIAGFAALLKKLPPTDRTTRSNDADEPFAGGTSNLEIQCNQTHTLTVDDQCEAPPADRSNYSRRQLDCGESQLAESQNHLESNPSISVTSQVGIKIPEKSKHS